MDKELKEQWIEALESGKYRKAKYLLTTNNNSRKCCLAVLAIIRYEQENGTIHMTGDEVQHAYDDLVNTSSERSPFKDNEEELIVYENDHNPGYPIQWIKDNL